MKKLFFLTIIIFSIYKVFTCFFELSSLVNTNRQNNILEYSKFAYIYGTEENWINHGGNEVVDDYESGYRFINFKNYETFYRAYDKHDDILGTVIEKKTGTEKLYIQIEFGDGLSLVSSEMSKCDFVIYNIPNIIRRYIKYVDGKVVGIEGLPYEEETIENACEQLISSINNFEEIAIDIYHETYQILWAEQIHRLIQYILLLLGCLIVWKISNSYWFNHIIIRKKK